MEGISLEMKLPVGGVWLFRVEREGFSLCCVCVWSPRPLACAPTCWEVRDSVS